MYTSLAEAKVEVWKRWNNSQLKNRVESYLGCCIPDILKNQPRAVIFRNVISPNLEYLRFMELARETGLEPLGFEYHEDRFCTRNVDKLGLAKMRVFLGRDKKGMAITSCEKIIDIKASDNNAFTQIQTLWGENIVDFHRKLTIDHVGRYDAYDLSDWIRSHSCNALENYRKFFALFVCHGVLFENFVRSDAASAHFTDQIAYPAFYHVCDALGISPLVVRIYSNEELDNISSWCWPASAQKSIRERRTAVSGDRFAMASVAK